MRELERLVCPLSGQGLRLLPLEAAEAAVSHGRLRVARPTGYTPVGRTSMVLLREDCQAAYPVVDGIPVLRSPEMLTLVARDVDVTVPRFAEAYAEMDHYDAEGRVNT